MPHLYLRFNAAAEADEDGFAARLTWLARAEDGASREGEVTIADLRALVTEETPWATDPDNVTVFVAGGRNLGANARGAGAQRRAVAPRRALRGGGVHRRRYRHHARCLRRLGARRTGALFGNPAPALGSVARLLGDRRDRAGLPHRRRVGVAGGRSRIRGGVVGRRPSAGARRHPSGRCGSSQLAPSGGGHCAGIDQRGTAQTAPVQRSDGAKPTPGAAGFLPDRVETVPLSGSVLEFLAAPERLRSAPPINLLQGDFAVQRRPGGAWTHWRPAAALAAIGLALTAGVVGRGGRVGEPASGYVARGISTDLQGTLSRQPRQGQSRPASCAAVWAKRR